MTQAIGTGRFNDTPDSVQEMTSDRIAIQTLQLSDQGKTFIKGFESLRLEYYNDDFNYCTVGWGHLVKGKVSCGSIGIKEFTPITMKEAVDFFNGDVEKVVSQYVKPSIKVPLRQNEFDALVSLAFNIGSLGKKAPSLCRKINNGQYEQAAAEFLDITNGGIKGLKTRRAREYQIYMKGIYDSNH